MKHTVGIITACAVFFSATSAAAMSVNTPQADSVSGKVSITGTLESGQEGENVTISVFRPDFHGDLDALSESIPIGESVDLSDAYALAAQTVSGPQGTFSFQFTLSPEATGSGYYMAAVGSEGEEQQLTGFYMVSEAELANAIAALNACRESEAVKAFFESDADNHYASYLGLTSEIFDSLQDKNAVYSAVADKVARQTVDIQNLTEVVKVFQQYTALSALHETSNADTAKVLLEMFAEALELSELTSYATYTDPYFGQEYQADVLSQLVGKKLDDMQAFADQMNTAVILRALHHLTSWNDAYDKVIVPNREILTTINYARYESNTNRQADAKKAITKKSFATLLQMQEAFNDALSTASTGGSGNGSGGSGGSGGGGGRGSSDYYVPPVSSLPDTGNNDTQFPFDDLADVEWAQESVAALYEAGIVNGMDGRTFAPDETVTREQFLKMLMEGFDLLDSNAECAFDDVEPSAWYAPYVASAYEKKLTTGVSQTEFGIGASITREDMTVLAYRFLLYAGAAPAGAEAAFADRESISGYAQEAVGALSGAGIINGMGDGTFSPQQQATRAQAAKVVYDVLSYAGRI